MTKGDKVRILKYPLYNQTGVLTESVNHPELPEPFWVIKLDIPTIQQGQLFEVVSLRESNLEVM